MDDLEDSLATLKRRGVVLEPYTKLARAYLRGSGARLTPAEVFQLLGRDDVIRRVIFTAAEAAEDDD